MLKDLKIYLPATLISPGNSASINYMNAAFSPYGKAPDIVTDLSGLLQLRSLSFIRAWLRSA
ncbi:hypothetical protein ACFSFZ_17570 [Mixta tenebrionis]|uniref:Uncharacterized protein n=1 Tax=Mixta tenebrionis TaxID=2562439 RepID=A0A506V299_9GAMM|nr:MULTISPECIES: hypothetical protein [Mixta]TPW39775.1 hypothetical protein FKM52_18850 [Mixta tenebrionis]